MNNGLYWVTEDGSYIDVGFWSHEDAARTILNGRVHSVEGQYTETALESGWIYVESRDDEIRAGWYAPTAESLYGLAELLESVKGIRKFTIQKELYENRRSVVEAVRAMARRLEQNQPLYEMTLTELELPTSYSEIGKRLRKDGFRHIASGTQSRVWSRSKSDSVYKVYDRDDAVTTEYLDYALDHSDNPHVPRISGPPEMVSDKHMGVEIERLKPMTPVIWNQIEPVWFYGGIRKRTAPPEIIQRYKKTAQQYPQIDELLNDLWRNGILSKNKIDLAQYNWMLRGTTPVLIDPAWTLRKGGNTFREAV